VSAVLLQTLRMSWLWNVFAGFYLVAYAFWIPGLLGIDVLAAASILVTLALGASLLYDGFAAALGLQYNRRLTRAIPYVRARDLLGGVALLLFVDVYVPSSGRIVAHWPLDLAITVLSGVVMVYYAAAGQRS